MSDFRERGAAIAADRTRGASALVAELLPVLDEAMREGRSTTLEVARVVCSGQPAMASLWNVCAAALADFDAPGRYERRRREVERAPRALVRAATAALCDALPAEERTTVLTLSYSNSVAAALIELAKHRPFDAVCAESLPGGEGATLHDRLLDAGLRSRVVPDAVLTTYLQPSAIVIVGADAVSNRYWINKAGTYGVSAAAWFSGIPVYVLASRDKAASPALMSRRDLPRAFERTPVQLVTLVLTDLGAVPPDGLGDFCRGNAADVSQLISTI